jgi:hypothetical protein
LPAAFATSGLGKIGVHLEDTLLAERPYSRRCIRVGVVPSPTVAGFVDVKTGLAPDNVSSSVNMAEGRERTQWS